MSNPVVDITNVPRRMEEDIPGLVKAASGVGLGGFVLSVGLAWVSGDGPAFFTAYLTNLVFFLTLCLGALFFVLIHHVTRAGWSVVVRRLAELVAANVGLAGLLLLPVLLLGMKSLYAWADAPAHGSAPPPAGRHDFLNYPFFVLRMAVYFGVWTLIARYFLNTSVRQDQTGDPELSVKMQRRSAPALVAFGLTTTFAAIDLTMSLTPEWYSTMYGVYFFAGSVVGFQALLILLAAALQARGQLTGIISVEHYHDLGKLLFAFTVFWAYIAYSQYMLIWYSNIPEETSWYLVRQTGAWTYVSLGLLFGGFVFPFLGLISRVPKRRPVLLIIGAGWLLIVHWVDVFWLVAPRAHPENTSGLVGGLLLLTTGLGLGGWFMAGLARLMKSRSLLAERDPRLAESRHFENV